MKHSQNPAMQTTVIFTVIATLITLVRSVPIGALKSLTEFEDLANDDTMPHTLNTPAAERLLLIANSPKSEVLLADPVVSSKASHLVDKERQMAIMRQVLADMIRRSDVEGLSRLFRLAREEKQRQKLKRCLDILHSHTICQHTTSFYIWAQMYARSVMEDENNDGPATV